MAFVVVGFQVVTDALGRNGKPTGRDKPISQCFASRDAADTFCALARKLGPYYKARVIEVMKHDDL